MKGPTEAGASTRGELSVLRFWFCSPGFSCCPGLSGPLRNFIFGRSASHGVVR